MHTLTQLQLPTWPGLCGQVHLSPCPQTQVLLKKMEAGFCGMPGYLGTQEMALMPQAPAA